MIAQVGGAAKQMAIVSGSMVRHMQIGAAGNHLLRAGLTGKNAQPAGAGSREGIKKGGPISGQHPLDNTHAHWDRTHRISTRT